MRAGVPDLPSAHPIGLRLPSVYLEDDFTQRMVSAFDEVLAPIFTTLDCLESYQDPELAPADFLDLLAGWVALDLDDGWTLAQRRALVAHALRLHRWRGTPRGIAEQVALLTGGDVEVADSGGCTYSTEPGPALGAAPVQAVRVTVRVADPARVDPRRLREIVAGAVPAHVISTVEVIKS